MINWKKKDVLPKPEPVSISDDGKWEIRRVDGLIIFRAAIASEKTNTACYGGGTTERIAMKQCKENLEFAVKVYQQTLKELTAIIAESEESNG
jgi:hypothetical protein